MRPPKEIMEVWKRFERFPMETLTKVWYHQKGTVKKQRSVDLMKEHYHEFGINLVKAGKTAIFVCEWYQDQMEDWVFCNCHHTSLKDYNGRKLVLTP
ncbi:hypothetical protein CU633_15055 [Bacillus sp. V3-13]|uniref:hypothetical protein n=1 Tax=Bacillus sp. V3-13 TaxID=2053728 RepID=UPI000C766A47|nr:hypothetical protein [Bacillus sp. V3-13]PLR76664.1 hypothetical protein CU633_15055 [Bacillus sp. V3-13]